MTRGLYQSCRTEEQLAAVVAHEVGHVTLRHGLAAIKTSRLTEAFAIIGTEAVKEFTGANLAKLTEAFAGTVDDIIDQMVVARVLALAGVRRRRRGRPDRLPRRLQPGGAGGIPPDPAGSSAGKADKKGFFSTHPPAADRLEKVEALLADEKLAGETDPARTARFSKTR